MFLERGKVLNGNQVDCVQSHSLDRLAERVQLNAFVAPFANRVIDVSLELIAVMGGAGLAGYGLGRCHGGGTGSQRFNSSSARYGWFHEFGW